MDDRRSTTRSYCQAEAPQDAQASAAQTAEDADIRFDMGFDPLLVTGGNVGHTTRLSYSRKGLSP